MSIIDYLRRIITIISLSDSGLIIDDSVMSIIGGYLRGIIGLIDSGLIIAGIILYAILIAIYGKSNIGRLFRKLGFLDSSQLDSDLLSVEELVLLLI